MAEIAFTGHGERCCGYFFSCSRDSFTEGRRFRSGSFVRPPGGGKALLPHAVAPFSNLAVFLIIQAYGQAFEHAISGQSLQHGAAGSRGLRHIFEHGWPRSQPDPLLSGVASMKRFFTFACLGVAGVMMMTSNALALDDFSTFTMKASAMTLIRLNCPASSITGWTRARGGLLRPSSKLRRGGVKHGIRPGGRQEFRERHHGRLRQEPRQSARRYS